MLDMLSALNTLRRPCLLIRAARFGLAEYRRSTHLPRVLGIGPLPRSGEALMLLMDLELDIEAQRNKRTAEYSAARHVDVLIAMMGEARIVRAMIPQDGADQVKASGIDAFFSVT